MSLATATTAAAAIAALSRPVPGSAQLDDGVLTVGCHADGTPAGWPLWADGRARHTTIAGTAGAGATTLLRSILMGARTARLQAQVIDVYDASLRLLGYPAATSLVAAEIALAEQYDLITARLRPGGDRSLRLLVINDLHVFERHLLDLLLPVARHAARAGIAIVAGTHRLTLDTFGTGRRAGGEILRAELTQELVLLHTPDLITTTLAAAGQLPAIPGQFADGTATAGVGYLPRRSTQPFRAWLP